MSEQLHLVNADEALTGALATPKPRPDGKHAVRVAEKVKPTPGPKHAQKSPKPEPKPAPALKGFREQIEEAISSMEYERDDECYYQTLTVVSQMKDYSFETVRELAERPMPPGRVS